MSFAAAEVSTATEAIRARIADAAAGRRPLRIIGAGTWLDANHPVAANESLPLREHSGVVEYVPGDLTITVRAGTTLRDIARITGAERQWLTLDPHGTDDGTIGATIATASWGPLAHHFGTPRDVVLGLEFVTGQGTIARGGGRVVKNVAGFDLARLLTGSWGTLGVITEVTLRLRAQPEVDRTVAISVGEMSEAESVRALRGELAALAAVPFAAELLDDAMAHNVGIHDREVLLVRVGGNEPSVTAQIEALRGIGDVAEQHTDIWRKLRGAEPTAANVLRLSQLPSRIGESWFAAGQLASAWPGTMRHATIGRGVVRCVMPAGDDITLLRALSLPFHGTRICERLPAAVWARFASSPQSLNGTDRLAREVKRTFDPQFVLNPGILGEVMP